MALNKLWGETFDWCGTAADLTMRWPLGATFSAIGAASVTAFNSGQCVSQFQGQRVFDDASNQATVYATARIRYNSGTAGSSNYQAISFNDGTSNQVTIMFMGDGSIVTRSGGVAGTVLDTHTSQFSLNAWASFQIKVVIHNSSGEVHIRKDGGTSDIITLTSVNTRAGTTNAYANRVQSTCNNATWFIDDFFGRSDDWCGDARGFEANPTGMATSAVFNQNVGSTPFNPYASTGQTTSTGNGTLYYLQFVVTKPGTMDHVVMQLNAGVTGHIKVAVYDNTGGGGTPGGLVGGSSDATTNPVSGAVQFDWSSNRPVVNPGTYFLAINSDVAIVLKCSGNSGLHNYTQSSSYASFPPASPGTLTTVDGNNSLFLAYQLVSTNWSLVGEQQQDGDVTYVASNNPGDSERYTFANLPSTAYAVICVNFACINRKTDSGSRVARINYENSGTVTQVGTFTPGTTYGLVEFVTVNDATGTPWSPTTVNANTAGPEVVS